MHKTTILKPRLSEKSYGLSQTARTYVFDVPADLNKHDVARSIEAQYETKVIKVNVTNIPGKAKRTIRKGGRAVSGRQSDTRKAYVRLAEGQTLPIFAAIDEAEAKEEATQVKIDKAMEKANAKEEKAAAKAAKREKK